MNIKILFFLFALKATPTLSQVSVRTGGLFFAKEFSKEIALYNAKTFVMTDVLGDDTKVIKFEIDPLAASNSGELTTLVYNCPEKEKSGLILGFYGNRWNDAGVVYQAYAFKNIPLQKATPLLDQIESYIRKDYKYLKEDNDNNNIYFKLDDITILVYTTAAATQMRVFWNGFDSEWEWTTFIKTKERLQRKLK